MDLFLKHLITVTYGQRSRSKHTHMNHAETWSIHIHIYIVYIPCYNLKWVKSENVHVNLRHISDEK